jgi:dTMP kinase
MNKGAFIVIDGIDGVGKATQTELLIEKLESIGHKGRVKKIDFPRYKENFFGRILAECKKGTFGDFSQTLPMAASLLYAADRLESKKVIEEWLRTKNIVISDRYVSANQIHQGGKIEDHWQRKTFTDWLSQLEYDFLRLPRPHIVVFLDASLEMARQNLAKRGNLDEQEKNLAYLANSRDSALQIAEEDKTWVKITCDRGGAMLSPLLISKEIMKALALRHIIPNFVPA